MKKIEQFIWADKYRPVRVDECILPKDTKATLQSFVDTKTMPHLLLHGLAGVGKTTAAIALCLESGYEYIIVNGSNEGRLIDTLRTRIAEFASGVSFTGMRRAVIIDEADAMPADTVQAALRNEMDTLGKNCAFILTCNFPSKLIEPIHSRCSSIEFTIPSEERKGLLLSISKRALNILQNESVTVPDQTVLVSVVKQFFPDFRRTLNEIQAMSRSGVLDATTAAVASGAEFEELMGYMSSGEWEKMRRFVARNSSFDIASTARKLYEKGPALFKEDSLPQFVLSTAEYQYKSSFALDKEIHMVAYLTELMVKCEFK